MDGEDELKTTDSGPLSRESARSLAAAVSSAYPVIPLIGGLGLAVGVVTWGTLSGSLLPFLLRKLRFDPASASAPFVATLVDVTGLIIYFSVASVMLRGRLL